MELDADRARAAAAEALGDFTVTPRMITIAALAAAIGAVTAYIAVALLALIGFFTNIFFYGRISRALVSPAGHHLGVWAIGVPVVGALIVGVMARYGSDKIRGHGIPEAIEAILVNGSRVEPKVALLKPVSAAISIGSGGPFGAEGPIIMTGGAAGSLIAQFFHLTSAERKTLLVAGAAAGMSATFAAPVASVILAIELLLFEWKPRSVVPVAIASTTAAILRRHVLGLGPVFPVPTHPSDIPATALIACLLAGLLAGGMSTILTQAVYSAEDTFAHLPIHWMWWPAIGGLVIGIGGYIFPPALGVGYDVIGSLLHGDATTTMIVGVLLVKSAIWSISLGSGTSGGVLAPLLMVGAALGGAEAFAFPAVAPGFWPLVSMGAVLAGTMRAPLTAVVFALELTHDITVLLPLLLATAVSYSVTVLVMKRSILTEKISRRGYHLSCEYAVDPLEIIFAREVARRNVASLAVDARPDTVATALDGRRQRLLPVIDAGQRLVGVIGRTQLDRWMAAADPEMPLETVIDRHPAVAQETEPLRSIASRMAETGVTRMPVVAADGRLVGMIALKDLLTARTRLLEAERRRERVLGTGLHLAIFGRGRQHKARAEKLDASNEELEARS